MNTIIDLEKSYDNPEWLDMCSEKSTYHPVEDALGLSHRVIWREL
ncbi:MAG: hypothetical protein ACFFAE_08955 [Candidatus Hodarchaeota archaeon]